MGFEWVVNCCHVSYTAFLLMSSFLAQLSNVMNLLVCIFCEGTRVQCKKACMLHAVHVMYGVCACMYMYVIVCMCVCMYVSISEKHIFGQKQM